MSPFTPDTVLDLVLDRTIPVSPEQVVAPSNGAGDLAFTARIEIVASPDGGSHYRAIVMHAREDSCRQHAEMGFADGWGAALDQLVALMS